jgi:hypothetical protein
MSLSYNSSPSFSNKEDDIPQIQDNANLGCSAGIGTWTDDDIETFTRQPSQQCLLSAATCYPERINDSEIQTTSKRSISSGYQQYEHTQQENMSPPEGRIRTRAWTAVEKRYTATPGNKQLNKH